MLRTITLPTKFQFCSRWLLEVNLVNSDNLNVLDLSTAIQNIQNGLISCRALLNKANKLSIFFN